MIGGGISSKNYSFLAIKKLVHPLFRCFLRDHVSVRPTLLFSFSSEVLSKTAQNDLVLSSQKLRTHFLLLLRLVKNSPRKHAKRLWFSLLPGFYVLRLRAFFGRFWFDAKLAIWIFGCRVIIIVFSVLLKFLHKAFPCVLSRSISKTSAIFLHQKIYYRLMAHALYDMLSIQTNQTISFLAFSFHFQTQFVKKRRILPFLPLWKENLSLFPFIHYSTFHLFRTFFCIFFT